MDISLDRQPSVAVFTIRLDASEVDAAFARVAASFQREARIPGYRKGKAPLSMVRERFRDEIAGDAKKEAASVALHKALEAHPGITPLGDSEMRGMNEVAEGKGAELTARVECLPDVELVPYRGVKIQAPAEAVTDADLELMRRNLLEQASRWENRARAASHGDLAFVSYKTLEHKAGTPGDEILEGKAEAYAVEVGRKRTIPGFEEAILGMNPGDEKIFPIQFPEGETYGPLSGRRVHVALKVNEVKERIAPNWDDALAASLGHKDATALDTAIRERTAAMKKQARRQALEDGAVSHLVEKHPALPVPEGALEEEFVRLTRRLASDLALRGVPFEKFLEREKLTPESFREKMLPRARDTVRGFLLLLSVAKKEALAASQEDILTQIVRASLASGEDPGKVAAKLTRRQISRLRQEVLCQKALNIILESAEIEEESTPEEVTA